MLQRSSATAMNLSFLTSDFWAILAALFVFDATLNFLYFVAFFVIVAGVLLYHYGGAVSPIVGEEGRVADVNSRGLDGGYVDTGERGLLGGHLYESVRVAGPR